MSEHMAHCASPGEKRYGAQTVDRLRPDRSDPYPSRYRCVQVAAGLFEEDGVAAPHETAALTIPRIPRFVD